MAYDLMFDFKMSNTPSLAGRSGIVVTCLNAIFSIVESNSILCNILCIYRENHCAPLLQRLVRLSLLPAVEW